VTLRCECGGPVRVQDGTDPDHADRGFFELYQCADCGRTGTLRADGTTGKTHLSGCLTRSRSNGGVRL
jgi:hypothetical protein